jgi:hypothetical protein
VSRENLERAQPAGDEQSLRSDYTSMFLFFPSPTMSTRNVGAGSSLALFGSVGLNIEQESSRAGWGWF